jgi:hypothetical protein
MNSNQGTASLRLIRFILYALGFLSLALVMFMAHRLESRSNEIIDSKLFHVRANFFQAANLGNVHLTHSFLACVYSLLHCSFYWLITHY